MPLVNLGNDSTLCEGNTLRLNATYLTSTYLWQDGNTNPAYIVNNKGTYHVRVNYNGCIKSDTVVVKFNLRPRLTLGPDQPICNGTPVTLAPVTDASWSLRWQDGSTGRIYTVTQPGSYTLSATNNCGTTSDDVLVTKGLCSVHMPNAFTPNGDGTNDLYKALGTEAVTEFNLRIFNRYGQPVFETTDKYRGWDGKFRGAPLPIGGFVYILSYKENNTAEAKMMKGTVILIR